jgi:hypothetical protein
VQIPDEWKPFCVDEIVKLVIQFGKRQSAFILLRGIVLRVWDEIEDIRSQIFDCDSWPPTVMDRSQEIFLLLVYGSIHTLLWRVT